ncbi:hypothetical protein ACB092_06G212400 [Castanea dentata]
MSQNVFVVYRNAIATVVIAPFAIVMDRKRRPKLTFSVFVKIMSLALLDPVIDQNLLFTGMKYTTATFSRALGNVVPAFTFSMAWILGLEKAKVLGTIVTVGGAMLMTPLKGPMLNFPWRDVKGHQKSTSATNKQDINIKGALIMLAGRFFLLVWFRILQFKVSTRTKKWIRLVSITLKLYPADISLTVLICLAGTLESTILALAMEWNNLIAWSIHLDAKLLAAVYTMKFYAGRSMFRVCHLHSSTDFTPLSTILVAMIGSFILSETMYFGMSIVIAVGLYLVFWGKSKDQPGSKSNSEEVAPTANMATMYEKITTSNQEFMAVNVTNIKSTNQTT